MNDAAEELLGYAEDDLEGESWEVIVPKSDSDKVEGVVSDLLENKGGYHSVNKNLRKDGERIVCEWHNRVVTDDSGAVIAIFSQVQDITKRKQREQAVEELYNTAQELMQAQTSEEVAEIVVEAVRDVLDMPVNAVYLSAEHEAGLVPVAWTDHAEELVGELPTIPKGGGLGSVRNGRGTNLRQRFHDLRAPQSRDGCSKRDPLSTC